MLRTNAPVAEISVRAGYATSAAFSKAFKHMIGVSPHVYRVMQRQAGTDLSKPETSMQN